jgi:glycosyltransferase involved in cell wall biosynthesis
MKIGIDARLIEETGVGRYIRNLLTELGKIYKKNEYVVFLRRGSFNSFRLPNKRWHKALADVPWHTLTEQFVMPGIFAKEKIDLLHVPYFNVPILYRGPFVLTVHDLTILHFDTGKASTHPWIFYKLRRLGYRIIVRWGIMHAKHLIAVSQATKREIMDHFPVSQEKISVTYEGVDARLTIGDQRITKKRLIADPYYIYVGNAYPHKNLETLLMAFQRTKGHKLVLVGKDDFFYKRLRNKVEEMNLGKSIIFFGPADDRQLTNLYTHAKAFVFPSLMEGFGLPALEALSLGCPVVVSDIPIFHEILGDAAVYFNPHDSRDLATKLTSEILSRDAKDTLQKFSWKKMASETARIYERSTRV